MEGVSVKVYKGETNRPYSGDSRVTSISCYSSKENTATTDLPAVTEGEMMEMVNEDHRDKHVKPH
jgi:hypothetical protein